MAMKALALGLLVLACAAVTALGCSSGDPCPDNLCCSQYGSGGDSCGPGCQSGPCYITMLGDPQCGSQAGGSLCAGNQCCSQYSYCGLGGDYCGDGCQSGPCYDGPAHLLITEALML